MEGLVGARPRNHSFSLYEPMPRCNVSSGGWDLDQIRRGIRLLRVVIE
jgi:hypothetical protein